MIPARKRRWSFSLRTLFVAVTVLCVWLGYELNWIHQRHALLARRETMFAGLTRRMADLPPDGWQIGDRIPVGVPRSPAPWSLRILGEDAIAELDFAFCASEGQTRPNDREWHEVELCRSLFPEAQIEWRLLIPKTPR
jgi:hypothetical protein